MDELTIAECEIDEAVVLSLGGYVDADTAPSLYRRLTALRADGCRKFVIDCTGVTFLSSRGIWTLLKHALELRPLGGDIRLAQLRDNVAQTLRDLRVEQELRAFNSAEEAARSF